MTSMRISTMTIQAPSMNLVAATTTSTVPVVSAPTALITTRQTPSPAASSHPTGTMLTARA